MNNCRLYIVEGLPCSGKSSASKFIAGISNGLLFDEGSGNHPADYEFSAFIPDSATEFTPEEREKLNSLSQKQDKGIVVELNKLDGALFDKAFRYKIYDCLDWDNERRVMLDKWRSFVQNADKDSIYVFNCVLLQNPMCETMMRFNFDKELSFEYIRQICKIIKPLNPTVVYLENNEISRSIKGALAERGEEWLNAVVDYHCNGNYGKAHGLSGFEGYISALEERQRRELEFLPQLPVRSVVLTDPQQNWEETYRKIRNLRTR